MQTETSTTAKLYRKTTVCKMLDLSFNGLAKLQAKDSTFPKPIKFGTTQQAPVFYDAAELSAWLSAKKLARGGL